MNIFPNDRLLCKFYCKTFSKSGMTIKPTVLPNQCERGHFQDKRL